MGRLWGPCQIIILIYLMAGHSGYAKRPVVMVTPNYNKILTGEKIMMTCDVESDALNCSWYHNKNPIFTGRDYVISMTKIRHSGDYQCQNSAGERSEIVTLNVTKGRVVLQAPVYIYEGDDVSLRCYSPIPARQTIFYKNNQMIQTNDSDLLLIKSTDFSSTYSCSKQILTTFYNTYTTDNTSITYTDPVEGDSVIFTPEYNKLLTGEKITMTSTRIGASHYWYKDTLKVADGQSYTITSAQVGHSGIYQCRTNAGKLCNKFRLDVSDDPVILQAPPLVYQDNDMVLRCHSRLGYRVINTTFYKDGNVIQPSTNNLATVTILRNTHQVGRYKCEKTFSWDENVTYTDEASLHIRELFPKPIISIVQNPVREGDDIICNTSLSPPKEGTLLHFTFYRDEQEVPKFNSSSKVLNVRLEDSGNYSCKVRTANNTVWKESAKLYIQIKELFQKPNLTSMQNPVTKGENLTLICNTSLSPLIQKTELRFAFYRNGQNIQSFGLTNQYEVQSTQLENSGNYSCEVKTQTNSVKKRSEDVFIQIKEYEHNSTAFLVTISVIIILLIIIIILIFVNKNRCKPLITSVSKRQTEDPQETESHRGLPGDGDVCYADIRINRKAPATHTTSNEDLCYVNFTASKSASSPKVAETVVYSEIKPRTET